jgi:hypothetical protein
MIMNKVKEIIRVILGKVKMPKIVISIIKKIFKVLTKIVKGFMSWLWKAIKESIAQVWTLLGFFIAWLTLTGTAQQVVGLATLLATAIWLVTIPLREEKEE